MESTTKTAVINEILATGLRLCEIFRPHRFKMKVHNYQSKVTKHLPIFFCRVMHITIDSTKVDHGPVLDNRVHMSLYYVCFVVIFSFFFLNIFVALIIVTFQERGERELTGCELTKNQVTPSPPIYLLFSISYVFTDKKMQLTPSWSSNLLLFWYDSSLEQARHCLFNLLEKT